MNTQPVLPIVPPRPAKYPAPSTCRERSKTEGKLPLMPTPDPPRRRNTAPYIELNANKVHKVEEDIISLVDSWLPKQETKKPQNNKAKPHESRTLLIIHKIIPQVSSNSHTFGKTLTELQEYGYNLPIILFLCVEYLTIEGL